MSKKATVRKSNTLRVLGCITGKTEVRQEFQLMAYLAAKMNIRETEEEDDYQEDSTEMELKAENEKRVVELLQQTKGMNCSRNADSDKTQEASTSMLERLHSMEWKRNQQEQLNTLREHSKQRNELEVRSLPQKSTINIDYFSGTRQQKNKSRKKVRKESNAVTLKVLGIPYTLQPRVSHQTTAQLGPPNVWMQKPGTELFSDRLAEEEEERMLKFAIEESLRTAQEERNRSMSAHCPVDDNRISKEPKEHSEEGNPSAEKKKDKGDKGSLKSIALESVERKDVGCKDTVTGKESEPEGRFHNDQRETVCTAVKKIRNSWNNRSVYGQRGLPCDAVIRHDEYQSSVSGKPKKEENEDWNHTGDYIALKNKKTGIAHRKDKPKARLVTVADEENWDDDDSFNVIEWKEENIKSEDNVVLMNEDAMCTLKWEGMNTARIPEKNLVKRKSNVTRLSDRVMKYMQEVLCHQEQEYSFIQESWKKPERSNRTCSSQSHFEQTQNDLKWDSKEYCQTSSLLQNCEKKFTSGHQELSDIFKVKTQERELKFHDEEENWDDLVIEPIWPSLIQKDLFMEKTVTHQNSTPLIHKWTYAQEDLKCSAEEKMGDNCVFPHDLWTTKPSTRFSEENRSSLCGSMTGNGAAKDGIRPLRSEDSIFKEALEQWKQCENSFSFIQPTDVTLGTSLLPQNLFPDSNSFTTPAFMGSGYAMDVGDGNVNLAQNSMYHALGSQCGQCASAAELGNMKIKGANSLSGTSCMDIPALHLQKDNAVHCLDVFDDFICRSIQPRLNEHPFNFESTDLSNSLPCTSSGLYPWNQTKESILNPDPCIMPDYAGISSYGTPIGLANAHISTVAKDMSVSGSGMNVPYSSSSMGNSYCSNVHTLRKESICAPEISVPNTTTPTYPGNISDTCLKLKQLLCKNLQSHTSPAVATLPLPLRPWYNHLPPVSAVSPDQISLLQQMSDPVLLHQTASQSSPGYVNH